MKSESSSFKMAISKLDTFYFIILYFSICKTQQKVTQRLFHQHLCSVQNYIYFMQGWIIFQNFNVFVSNRSLKSYLHTALSQVEFLLLALKYYLQISNTYKPL